MPRDTLLSGWRFEDPAFTDVDWGCGYPYPYLYPYPYPYLYPYP